MLQKVKYKSKEYLIAQRCDTIVNPTYRDKGLFKRMNNRAILEAKKLNILFFYNFPNSNSEPGYLKIGWNVLTEVNEQFLFNDFSKLVKARTNNFFKKRIGDFLGLYFNKKSKINYEIMNKSYIIQKVDTFDNSFENMGEQKNSN